MAVEPVCHLLLSIIVSSGAPCCRKSSAALAKNEWPVIGCRCFSNFNPSCSAFKMVFIRAVFRLLPMYPCLLMDLRL